MRVRRRPAVRRRFAVLGIAISLAGCSATPPPAPPPQVVPPKQRPEVYVPYRPSTQPAAPSAAPVEAEQLPTKPRDPLVRPSLLYGVELWELQLPMGAVSRDDSFWKRVDENIIDLATHDRFDKNGMRIGALSVTDLPYLNALIDERKGKKTTFKGLAGKNLPIPIGGPLDRQTLLFIANDNQPTGRSFERCSNLFHFSFAPVPRSPNLIRLALTPAVKFQSRRMIFSIVPGKPDRETGVSGEESRYDASLVLDLPLSSVLVVAPSLEARAESSLGHAFLIARTPAQEFERLIIVVPQAYQRADEAASADAAK